jgi:hypothetical protein
MATAQIQTVNLYQALALPFDERLSSLLLERLSSDTKDIGTYHPGELLRMSIKEVSSSDVSEVDANSDVSTSDTLALDRPSSSRGDSDELDESDAQSGFGGFMSNFASPSIGSANHGLGLCSPCGFVHRLGGCSNGSKCTFCHLCLPGSIQRQRKLNKKSSIKTAKVGGA